VRLSLVRSRARILEEPDASEGTNCPQCPQLSPLPSPPHSPRCGLHEKCRIPRVRSQLWKCACTLALVTVLSRAFRARKTRFATFFPDVLPVLSASRSLLLCQPFAASVVVRSYQRQPDGPFCSARLEYPFDDLDSRSCAYVFAYHLHPVARTQTFTRLSRIDLTRSSCDLMQ